MPPPHPLVVVMSSTQKCRAVHGRVRCSQHPLRQAGRALAAEVPVEMDWPGAVLLTQGGKGNKAKER